MSYDIWSPYDPLETDTAEIKARRRKRLQRDQQAVRTRLPRLRREIKNPDRDFNSVSETLAPYYEGGHDLPLTPADLPELEALYRLILEKGGPRQEQIQEALLRLVGATAAAESVSFLLEALHYTRRGDRFGPERRQLALWGLARIAIFHNDPEAYRALQAGLDDRNANVRGRAADLVLDAYLNSKRPVPEAVVAKLREMAHSDPDDDIRYLIQRFLQEPWANEGKPGFLG